LAGDGRKEEGEGREEEAAQLVMPMKMRRMGGDREVEDGGGGERLFLAA
jgi:hypothetical protein